MGQVAIITGAGQGLGAAYAERLAVEGAHVVIAEVVAESGERMAQSLIARGLGASFYEVDVRDADRIQAMVDDLVERFGRIDVLVNNAGIGLERATEDMTREEWDRVLGINLTGVLQCSQIVGRVMIRQRSGRIINIASMVGIGGWAERSAYASSKAGVISLSQVHGVEWARYNVRVNAICPGQFLTERHVTRTAMQRSGDPTELAEAVLFLASEESSYVNAAVITIDGGWLAWGALGGSDARHL